MSNIITWDGIMNSALSMPLVKVDREKFLSEAFSSYGDISSLNSKRPIDLFSSEIIEKVAKDITDGHLTKVTGISAVAGLPGGLAMAGTIPADLAQYYWHALVLAQKLGYVYGWSDLLDENKSITEGTRNVLTLFIGVMMGAQGANKAIGEIAKRSSIQVAKRLPQKALTKTAYYPIAKQIGKQIGLKVTKSTFSNGVSKLIPVLGGAVSGALTYASFRPMAIKLRTHLRNEMELSSKFSNNNSNQKYSFYEEAEDINFDEEFTEEELNNVEVNLEYLRLQATINIAKIDFELHNDEIELLTEMINDADLTDSKKMELLNELHSKELSDIDFSIVKGNKLYSLTVLENLLSVINIDGIKKPAEKIYFNKVANELGFTKEEAKELFENEDFSKYSTLSDEEIEYVEEFKALKLEGEIGEKERRMLIRIAKLLGISESRMKELEKQS